MDYLEDIDRYFTGAVSEEETRRFSKRLEEDPQFAEEVAFYIQARAAGHEINAEEKKTAFKELNVGNPPAKVKPIYRRIVPSLAAASVLLATIGIFLMRLLSQSPMDMAEKYVKDWNELSVTMGPPDPLQTSRQLYNEGKYSQALDKFEQMLRTDSLNPTVLQYAGKAAFKMKDFDKAIHYFSTLGSLKLQTNEGLFDQALVYIKRNSAGDPERAKELLQQVVNEDLEGKNKAQELLKKL